MGRQANYSGRRFPKAAIVQARYRQTGPDGLVRCACGCGKVLTDKFIRDHYIPWEISRHSGPRNCQLLALDCDKRKTRKDQGVIAKGRRLRERKVARHPMPCGRDSRWSKPVGKLAPVLRTSQAQKLALTIAARRFDLPEASP